jgi:hypothetical protein
LEIAQARRRAGLGHRLAAAAQFGLAAVALLDEEPQAHRGGVPARRDQAAEMGARRRRLVEMERLGVELPCERLDLVRREGVAPDLHVPTM